MMVWPYVCASPHTWRAVPIKYRQRVVSFGDSFDEIYGCELGNGVPLTLGGESRGRGERAMKCKGGPMDIVLLKYSSFPYVVTHQRSPTHRFPYRIRIQAYLDVTD